MAKIHFKGRITGVKARIRLLRSFDQVPTHSYLGYCIILSDQFGTESSANTRTLRIAVGPKTHEKNQFRIGDLIEGQGEAVLDRDQEWADLYKISALKVLERGSESEVRTADPDGGIAPPLQEYRERGHFRLQKKTWEEKCQACAYGLMMPTQIILDHWNPSKQKWRFETHCYGPRDCPRYKAGPPYRVQGRKSFMIYVDDDVERAELEE